jgi:hypothetical protein
MFLTLSSIVSLASGRFAVQAVTNPRSEWNVTSGAI